MNLIIDTNIFRKNPKRDNTEWHAISFLAVQDKIKIFMPYIIQEEYISQQEDNRVKEINTINK